MQKLLSQTNMTVSVRNAWATQIMWKMTERLWCLARSVYCCIVLADMVSSSHAVDFAIMAAGGGGCCFCMPDEIHELWQIQHLGQQDLMHHRLSTHKTVLPSTSISQWGYTKLLLSTSISVSQETPWGGGSHD